MKIATAPTIETQSWNFRTLCVCITHHFWIYLSKNYESYRFTSNSWERSTVYAFVHEKVKMKYLKRFMSIYGAIRVNTLPSPPLVHCFFVLTKRMVGFCFCLYWYSIIWKKRALIRSAATKWFTRILWNNGSKFINASTGCRSILFYFF